MPGSVDISLSGALHTPPAIHPTMIHRLIRPLAQRYTASSTTRPMIHRMPRAIAPRAMFATSRPMLRPPLTVTSSRDLHQRAISFSTIPRMMAKAFRLPMYGAAIGAGGAGYAHYKLEGKCYPYLMATLK